MAKKLDKSRPYGTIFGDPGVPGLEGAKYYQDGKYFTGIGKLIINSGKISKEQNKKEQELADADETVPEEPTAAPVPASEENTVFLDDAPVAVPTTLTDG